MNLLGSESKHHPAARTNVSLRSRALGKWGDVSYPEDGHFESQSDEIQAESKQAIEGPMIELSDLLYCRSARCLWGGIVRTNSGIERTG